MEGFTLVDAVVAGVIVLSAILAYSRGLIREVSFTEGAMVRAGQPLLSAGMRSHAKRYLPSRAPVSPVSTANTAAGDTAIDDADVPF